MEPEHMERMGPERMEIVGRSLSILCLEWELVLGKSLKNSLFRYFVVGLD